MTRLWYLLLLLLGVTLFSCKHSSSGTNYSSTTPSSIEFVVSNDDILQTLSLHNEARSVVDVDLMEWDETLADEAKLYASIMRDSGTFAHDPDNTTHGENLFISSDSLMANPVYIASTSWYNEEQFFDITTNTCKPGQQCGHYTQMVWHTTTKVGCAIDIFNAGSYDGWVLVVCRYSPPGNIVGQKPF